MRLLFLLLALHQLLLTSPTVSAAAGSLGDLPYYFASTGHVNRLLQAGGQLAGTLLEFADDEAAKLDRVREFARDLRRAATDGAGHADHPVAAFLAIRRMALDWRRLLGDRADAQLLARLARELDMPTPEDLDGAADALVRLQDVYDIPAARMVRGQLTQEGDERPPLLSVDDALLLVRRAFHHDVDTVGMDWARLLLESDTFASADRSTVLPALLDALRERFQQVSLQKHSDIYHLERVWHANSDNITVFVDRTMQWVEQTQKHQTDMVRYRQVCRETALGNNGASQRLSCRFAVPHPFFTLAPVKEELLSEDPRVVFLYDVLTDRESDRLMEISDPRIRRARFGGEVSDIRISKIVFLYDEEDWSVARVTRKMGLITGLNVADSDILQVGNYGIGGQYEPHMDSFGHDISKRNDRVATVLLYLNNVQRGGGTVFPRLGLGVLPVRNGALFWYNLRRNASQNTDTLHAACPVLEGSKWVANKWIYYLGQMRKRPCGLSQFE